MRIGYLINTYPRPSHSFIRREIAALERIGYEIHRFAMRGDAAALTDPADLREHSLTERVLEAGGLRLFATLLRRGVSTPRALLEALGVARARAKAGESSFSRQLIYLAEGAYVATRAQELGLQHIHAHFGTNSTRVAFYAHLLGGPGFSFTVHGPEEFDQPQSLDLAGKMARSRFCVAISSYGRSQLFRWAQPDNWPKVNVVHCGIDMHNWSAISALPQSGPFHLVAVGRFAEQKGFGLLIHGFAQAWRKNPALRLSLVGDGELRQQIETLIKSEGMGDAVALLGWQDEAGVRAAMEAAHALIVPSFAEGLPVVIMEAMACARPTLATYIAGIPELVRPGLEGWLMPAGSPDELGQTILDAASQSPEQLTKMGLSARARVSARHDIDESARRLAALFQEHAS